MRSVLLVNTNVSRPPVSPVGLEYTGESLLRAGVPVRVVDLAFETDRAGALARALKDDEPLMVGASVRNTDDCCFATRKSFLPWLREVVAEIRRLTQAPVVLGGVGFSVMPEPVLRFTGADYGIAGDGEETVVALADRLAGGEDITSLPNLVYQRNSDIVRNPRAAVDLQHLPPSRRNQFDNRRYERQGAMVGIETKRGCTQRCIFCADPLAKGRDMRLRQPSDIVLELRALLAQGVTWFHLCDSEFNLPITHAREVCQAVIQAGLGDRIRWYAYCAPVPFDQELAHLMKRAGCGGINFGVDSLCDEQLARLGRNHRVNDIEELVHILKKAGMNYIFDLLVGGPGETEETVKTTVEEVQRLNVPLAGIAYGVRVYPGTTLWQATVDARDTQGLHPRAESEPDAPLFYLSPNLGKDAASLIGSLVGGDPRFLFLAAPDDKQSYNYAGDEALCRLIEKGARGAYWDIIRQSQRG